eukprot:TRINITY_DN60601_c0_g1_i1.p1 TRINITY_DN60601_c0_g1~~TRINITY_DN60601_c0_g1_i1.p1  ORF type:complete len:402 (-),score=176.42 TRINITY_DN60601_c0_g1_i1:32-1237(-)
MKKAKVKDPENFAFDDDTSDSDDDQLQAFNSKVGDLKPLFGNQPKTSSKELPDAGTESNSSDEDEEDDELDDSEESEDESDEESETESIPSLKPKVSEEKLAKLSKLQMQLADMGKDESEESEEESSDDEVDEEEEVESKNPNVEEQNDEISTKTVAVKVKRTEEEEASPSKKQKTEELGPGEKERKKYRDKLTKMSIEDIQNLKERLGLKLFHQKMSGTAPVRGKKVDFKRENKNRPREMSSKKTVGRFREVVQVAKVQQRDPRFDPLCGEFDEKLFKDNYKFVNEMKSQDLTFLKKQIREEEDPERRKSIKYLIQRTENQLRQEAQNKVKEQELAVERDQKKDQLEAGVKPFYVSKSKQKEIKLVDQYEKLKQSGGLDNYIRKKTKKNLVKDRKKFEKL